MSRSLEGPHDHRGPWEEDLLVSTDDFLAGKEESEVEEKGRKMAANKIKFL